MAALDDIYLSSHGWCIRLPPGWQRLPGTGGEVIAMHRPEVFVAPDDDSLCITWMIFGRAVNEEAGERFVTGTISDGPLEIGIASTLIAGIGALIGNLYGAQCLRLPDGTRALELFETYEESGTRGGYQLIFPLAGSGSPPRAFQRLCFYAPRKDFERLLPLVTGAARSFHYRPVQAG